MCFSLLKVISLECKVYLGSATWRCVNSDWRHTRSRPWILSRLHSLPKCVHRPLPRLQRWLLLLLGRRVLLLLLLLSSWRLIKISAVLLLLTILLLLSWWGILLLLGSGPLLLLLLSGWWVIIFTRRARPLNLWWFSWWLLSASRLAPWALICTASNFARDFLSLVSGVLLGI